MRAPLRTILIGLVLGGCEAEKDPFVGSLEWDRVDLIAELSEPILRIAVSEGEVVEPGDVLLEFDRRRQDSRIAAAKAALSQANARLAELTQGARIETIEAAQASVQQAQAARLDAEREYTRVEELREQDLVSDSAVDEALADRDQRRAETAAAEARLRELTQGTRPEQIEQAAAAVQAAEAILTERQVALERLTVRAPRRGRVDSLPFHVGSQPPQSATVVSLLVGDAPYARVFIPATERVDLVTGRRFEVRLEGVSTVFDATLRHVRSEPSFTPYYALSGDDASRLVYRAELVLEGEDLAELPAGLPLTAVPRADEPGPAGE